MLQKHWRKMAFLKGMFDVEINSEHDVDGISKEESDEMSYWAMLNTIKKYAKSENLRRFSLFFLRYFAYLA